MVRRAAFVLLWVVATLVATGVGLAAVRGVAGQVVDAPSTHLLTVAATTTTAPEELRAMAVPPAADGAEIAADDEAFPEAPPPQPPDATNTTIANEQVAGKVPPEPGVETSDTTKGDGKPAGDGKAKSKKKSSKGSPPIEEQTHQLKGGWVRITYGEVEVDLDAAGPAPGFTMLISEAGPETVNITFRGKESASRLRAEWQGGKLVVDIVESPKGQR